VRDREEATGRTGKPREERLKPERPRDELGRPQPWEADNVLEMEDFDSLPLEENHRLGVSHFNAGRYFPAHEAWETAWKQSRDTDDAEFFKGLSQLGAGYVHLLRGNAHGAWTLLRRASGRIARYPKGHHGVNAEAVAARADADANAVEGGTLAPGPGALAGREPRI
jgi:predicted metal-dependent hydrolase